MKDLIERVAGASLLQTARHREHVSRHRRLIATDGYGHADEQAIVLGFDVDFAAVLADDAAGDRQVDSVLASELSQLDVRIEQVAQFPAQSAVVGERELHGHPLTARQRADAQWRIAPLALERGGQEADQGRENLSQSQRVGDGQRQFAVWLGHDAVTLVGVLVEPRAHHLIDHRIQVSELVAAA